VELLTSPENTKDFLRLKLAGEHNEVFGCIFLDNRHRVIAVDNLFFGTIDGASVYPRVIAQKALMHNAAAIVAYHNHPSGVAEPSQADLRITQRIKEAVALVDVRLLDHLVVCVGECTSFAERGLL
jgi:DNA repair protein RadC